MNLEALKVNRYLYRADINPVEEGSISMSANVNSSNHLNTKSERSAYGAKDIVSGTVITSCFVKSSDKATRVELVPVSFNQTGDDQFGEDTFEDALIAWRDVNSPAVVIDQHGIWTDELFINGEMTVLGELIIIGGATIDGIAIPFSQWGLVDSSGAGASLPPGWSSVESVTGVYTVTHNIGFTGNYAVVASPLESGGLIRLVTVVAITANTFVIAIRDSGAVLTSTSFFFNVLYDSGSL